MVTHFRTLLLLGVTAVTAASLSGCIIDTSDGATCADSQYFDVQWEVDTGAPVPLSCAQTPSSYVQITTNFGQALTVFEDTCNDAVLYNHLGATISGLAVGTTVVTAQLISSTGAVLSTVNVPPSAQVPIGSCTPVLHTFEFPII